MTVDGKGFCRLRTGRVAAVGKLRWGAERQGFFVLGPRPEEGIAPIAAHGYIRRGRVKLQGGMLTFGECADLVQAAITVGRALAESHQ